MAIKIDPEKNESRALLELADFGGRRVLEIGCGDGRLTWRYADRAGQVTAIDPSADAIAAAKENLPGNLRGRVAFYNVALDDFATAGEPSLFDLVILSWSL